jgi:hypothetical protein
MNDEQVGQTPILGREGLLRLVEVVERLRARARGEEGGSWTTGKTLAPQWAAKQCWAELPEANRRAAVRWLATLASRVVVVVRLPEAGATGADVWDPAGEGGWP